MKVTQRDCYSDGFVENELCKVVSNFLEPSSVIGSVEYAREKADNCTEFLSNLVEILVSKGPLDLNDVEATAEFAKEKADTRAEFLGNLVEILVGKGLLDLNDITTAAEFGLIFE